MSLEFTPSKFGAQSPVAAAQAADNRPQAELWINIGYTSDIQDDQGQPYFISLAQGVPLDTLEELPTNSRNDKFAAFNAARNDLQEQLMAFAEQLQPGEARTIQLEVQLRRKNAPAAPIDPAKNPMVRKLSF